MNRFRQVLGRPLDHALATVYLIYLGVLLLCWYFGQPQRAPDRDYVAVRELAHNHRITPADISRPATIATSIGFYIAPVTSIEGMYIRTKRSIKSGETIRTGALCDKPDMQLPERTQAFAFPLPAGSIPINLLDVGSPVVLLGQDPDSKSPVVVTATVHAIICDQKTNQAGSCYPILRIPADQSQLVAKNQAALRLALRPQVQP
jgi:hypothetical protein